MPINPTISKPGVQEYYAEYGRSNNPYFVANEWLHEHYKTDLYGYTRLTYKVNNDFSVALRTQVTTWNQLRTEKLPYSAISYKSPDLRQEDYREDRRNLLENNTDLSTVVSDYLKLPETVSFLKLRGSYANVRGGLTQSEIGTAYQAITGNGTPDLIGYGTDLRTSYDGPSYANQNSYAITTSLYNNTPSANYSGTLANSTLKSYTVKSYEYGFDAKFLRNRLSLDVTHFTTVNGPQIFALPLPTSTGYYNQNVNGLVTKQAGWEVAVTGSAIKNPNGLNWDVLANWSTYKETLKEIYGNETQIYLGGPDHVFKIGDRLDGYYSYNFLRDPSGNIIHSATGQPLTRPAGTNYKQFMGNTNPDFVWALNNRFQYKNFNFSFQFDGRVGGVIRGQVYAYALNAGNQQQLSEGALGAARLKEWQSTALSTKAPTPAYVGQGVVASGEVKFDASGNISNYSELPFTPNTKAVTVQSYTQGIYNSGIEESYIVSKTYMKLREVILGYSLPTAVLPRFIRAASVSVVGRNLLHFAQRKDFDLDQFPEGYSPTTNSTQRNSGLQSSTLRRFGVNLNLTF